MRVDLATHTLALDSGALLHDLDSAQLLRAAWGRALTTGLPTRLPGEHT